MRSSLTAPTPAFHPAVYLWRVPRLIWHLAVHLPVTLVVIATIGPRLRLKSGETLEHRVIRWWSAGLVGVFGFDIRAYGAPLPGAVLLVANHITWMDIEIIHSQRMANFVAKSEIAGWPIVGWLTTRAGTIFHRRGDARSLEIVQQTMVERLRDGQAVAVFPEGSTGPGDRVRTFHARIFSVCEAAQAPAQPVGLRFVRDGALSTAPAFRDGESFVANFFRLLGSPPVTAEVHFLAPIAVGSASRRQMATLARAQIETALGLRPPPLDEPSSDDLDPLADGPAA